MEKNRMEVNSVMKVIQDQNQLNQYLRDYQLETIFHKLIIPHLSLYYFDEGECICSQGESFHYLYVLVKGKLKVFTTSAEGKTLILSFQTPLALIGDIEFVRGIDIINTVEAISPVWMIGVHYRWLEKYGKEDPSFLQFLLDVITKKFYVKSHSMSFNLMYPVDVRLASYLLSVSYDEAEFQMKGQRLRTVSLKDVANLIGTSHRHLNRVIQQFCKEGLVERNKEFVMVKNREGLRALANHSIYE